MAGHGRLERQGVMVTEDQSDVIAYLERPSTHGVDEVQRLDTHASMVFLAGGHALKLKRAVRYDYLDFSTVEQRRRMCEAELRLNRRTAPTLYEDVVPVTRQPDGHLALAGSGQAVEWLVRMRRFEQTALLDRLAARGALPLPLMTSLGEAIGRLHRDAAPSSEWGGVDGMARVIDGNQQAFDEAPDEAFDRSAARRLTRRQQVLLTEHAGLLETRRIQGFVRHCHGDLHLRNLVVVDGQATLFDGIEFNDDLSCIDVLYDLAFLLMDLWHRGLRRHANTVWNTYLAFTADVGGLPLLPLLLSCRAAIRAKTNLAAASLATDDTRRRDAVGLAREYLSLAEAFLEPAPPVVIAVGGLSGSGKSSVAAALAPELGRAPGAVVVRSDALRKRLAGVDESTHLGSAGYTAEHTARVYAALVERCMQVAGARHAAIADAVFGRREQRTAVAAAAAAVSVPFSGVWLDAPSHTLVARVDARTGDVSDADADVVASQVITISAPDDWSHVDAARPLDAVIADVRAVVRVSY